MKKKVLIIVSVILSILLLSGGIFVVCKYFDDKGDNVNKEDSYDDGYISNAYDISYDEINLELDSEPKFSNDLSNLYMTNLSKQEQPKKLLVLIFQYSENPYYKEGTASEIEKMWSDYIFGTGKIEDGTASINDYFKEISNGKFYFEPVYVGGNTSGVYNVNLDKAYSDKQYANPDYPYFVFDVDIAMAIDDLVNKGLDISTFTAPVINNGNFREIMEKLWDAPQKEHLKEWYTTDKVLCIFPPVNTESVSFVPISTSYNEFNMYAHINYNSTFGTIVHELLHTLGTIDVYNFGSFGGDMMSDRYVELEDNRNMMHVNPYYKILFGWNSASVLENSATVTLYPPSSPKYNPVIIKTKDSGQYFIIEQRSTNGFDLGTFVDASDNINIWRVDKLGMEAIYDYKRNGIIAETLTYEGNAKELLYYKNYKDINDTELVSSGIKVKFVKKNEDGSAVVNIYQ